MQKIAIKIWSAIISAIAVFTTPSPSNSAEVTTMMGLEGMPPEPPKKAELFLEKAPATFGENIVVAGHRSHSSHASHYSGSGSYRSPNSYGNSSSGSSTYSSPSEPTRDSNSNSHIKRSSAAKHKFEETHPCPSTGKSNGACPGYVVDHVIPLKRGGADDPLNMQWQTTEDAKAKDKWE